MKRREFIWLLGGAAALWPPVVGAQQPDKMPRIGILEPLAQDDPEAQPRLSAFLKGLQLLGWTEGRNLRIDTRWTAGESARIHKYSQELVALAPDVILVSGSACLAPLLQLTRSIPLIFVIVPDPVGNGYVDSLARPGGNASGFVMFEFGLAAKWLELLKEVAPNVTRAGILRDATISIGIGQWAVIQSAAPSLGVDVTPINLNDVPAIERAVAAFARSPNDGLILTGSAPSAVHRDTIIALAARYKLPAVYVERLYGASGGLISYGPNFVDQYRQAAGYVDRILKGEKPANLPVQAPTKYELVINLKTANALGLKLPDNVLARADEVME